MTTESIPLAGPAKQRLTPEQRHEALAEKRTAIWRAVWEASQLMPLDDIATYVAGVLDEIRSDEP